jgi:SAM-dependent methyltransferase
LPALLTLPNVERASVAAGVGSAPVAQDLSATRAFFGPRAAGWEDRFPADGPAYARAVAELGLASGGVVLDVGCGTGRALPPLRVAVGPGGLVIGVDVTAEMLDAAARLGRGDIATLVLADGSHLPVRTGGADAVFAAGLLPHLADPAGGLAELARAVRPGGRLALFHPISRAALAARHHHAPSDDEVLSPRRLPALLAAAGWTLAGIDDGEERYLALADRASSAPAMPPPSLP